MRVINNTPMTLTSKRVILASITAFTVLAVWTVATNKEISQSQENQASATISSSLQPQEKSESNVTVTVAPITLKQGFPASFDVAFETHSVELDFDVETIASLSDTKGTIYKPTWQGSPPGGHHRSGTLIFTPDIPKQTELTLTLRDIAEVPTRVFQWNMR